ncbi:MAG: hypothetical protein MUC76_08360 [Spirochaetes bacterium]|jgi:hypothetical protein|nr:hypothetical protein [Spirochaetota bacterium]
MNKKFLATAIGSFPHTDAETALDVIFASIPDAPVWPQLPRLGLSEQMEIQYSEGMPRAVVDREKSRMYFDTSGDYSEEFGAFYEKYMEAMDPDSGSGDCSAMAIGREYSKGIRALESRLGADGAKRPYVKVQTTGPCSFALTVTDENKRAIYYNEEFRDVIVKALAMKCRWQIAKFRPFAERIICFIDEPILSAFGSSTYISVKREDVVAAIAELVDAIHADGAVAGVHCCGNTDWSILVDAGADLLNFDAFGYGETVALYGGALERHFGRGGLLAWGIVPTSAAIREQTVEGLAARYESLVDHLAGACGIDHALILDRTVITPSCGTGSMEIADAEKVLSILGELSRALKSVHGA